MNAIQRFVLAAASDLAACLAGQAPEIRQPKIAESTKKTSFAQPAVPPDFSALEGLARHVVETVLSLAGQNIDEKILAKQVERAAKKFLMAHPELPQASLSRLVAETPRLLNLPRLAELATQGMEVGPAQTCGLEPEQEIVMGPSAAFSGVLRDLEKVAETDFPVLLIGESGTGKEMLARRLHRLSPRRGGPLVPVNCAALVENLLESELFGHVKGAFSGAASPKNGYIRAAEGGTLFLDEIGETTQQFQVRLLRVLEDKVVVPVGSHQGLRVNFRLVAATHRDLNEEAAQGRFNQALLYRLNVVPLLLPPLRQRREDIPALTEHFLKQACLMAKKTRRLVPETLELLLNYSWPGNVRELSNLLQRLVALSEDYEIGPERLPDEISRTAAVRTGLIDYFQRHLKGLEGVPKTRHEAISRVLAAAGGDNLTNKDMREHLGCSDSTAKNVLRVMVQAGLLEPLGLRGGRHYRVLEPKEE